ncbi:PP2C family protein-serine/threonine phosphatase [Streptomyces sp. NPDC006012]|uniref:PP2C family protein-serine/threonine phosphatase n=1 Tax=Streptomyces sp. NPDC006012 TaxID=3364739 RepID=UPI0036971331
MPSHLSADRPAAQPPGRGSVEALISQTRRLKGEVDAVRRDTHGDAADPHERWQRALYDLALHQLNDLDEHLAQLRDDPPPVPSAPVQPVLRQAGRPASVPDGLGRGPAGSLLSRVGSAEWNLLTDEASWSEDLYRILGRSPSAPALTLDELPSLVLDEDRAKLTAMVTDCLVDAKPIDGEFRVVLPDGSVRTVHMMGEPVPDADGSTAAMWAVLRDVSELRRNQQTVRETRDSLRRQRRRARSGSRPPAEGQEAVLPPSHGTPGLPHRGPRSLDVAARRLTAAASPQARGDWYDTFELPDGDTLLGVGDLTGHGITVAPDKTMLMGALRGMALAGSPPARLMDLLNQLLDSTAPPAPASAVCCRYRSADRTLAWAQAGHPAPLLYRNGTGCMLAAPEGVPLGTTPSAAYGQAEATLEPGDLLLLRTDGLVPGHSGTDAVDRLLGMAPRFAAAGTAEDCVRVVVEEFGADEREDDACVLIAKLAA